MNKLKVMATTVLSAALVPWSAGMAEAAIIQLIDPLTTVQTTTRTQTSGTSQTTVNVPGTIFSTTNIRRRLSVTKQGGTGLGEAKIPTTNLGSGLEINNITGANSLVTLRYGTNNAVTNFPAVDFTVGGLADRFTLGILANDTGSTNVDTKFTVNINGIAVTKTLADKSSATPVFPLNFLFSEFTALNPAFNPTKVTSFFVTFDPAVEGDIAVSFIGVSDAVPPPTTPEPASMLGLLAVAGAVGTLRKKEALAK